MSENAEAEIRREFEEWFRDAAAKDLDAVLTKIADDAVSYEHEAPLAYVGVGAIGEVCRNGFDVMKGEFRWDIPDLHVVVRDDIAVTWGLNHMRARQPGGEKVESWSRGTRVFQRIDGAWKLIHQHVSDPYDPETGRCGPTSNPPDRRIRGSSVGRCSSDHQPISGRFSAASQPSSSTPTLHACDSVSSIPFAWKQAVW